MWQTYFVLMLQAFPFADGLCHLPGVSHLPRVCRHHAGPPPPPPPRGGLSLVMSGDNDPEHMPLKDLLSNLATASLMNQPVPQTFAQKQGPLLLLAGLLLSASILGASVYFGLLFAGRGKSLPFPLSIWGAKEKPPVTVKFGFGVITACVSTGIASCVSAVALCPLGQEP
jgi:hypothetical protein